MSARDVLFVFDGLDVVHLRTSIHLRPDLGHAVFIPACAARSDRRPRPLWLLGAWHDLGLRPCVGCHRTVAQAGRHLNHLAWVAEHAPTLDVRTRR